MDECKVKAENAIKDGSALKKFADMIHAQGGDERYIYNTELFDKPEYNKAWISDKDCYIEKMNTEMCGRTAVILGAGREVKDSPIDFTAGIMFYKKTGDYVKKGEKIAEVFSSDKDKLEAGFESLKAAYTVGDKKVKKMKEIIAYVTKDNVVWY